MWIRWTECPLFKAVVSPADPPLDGPFQRRTETPEFPTTVLFHFTAVRSVAVRRAAIAGQSVCRLDLDLGAWRGAGRPTLDRTRESPPQKSINPHTFEIKKKIQEKLSPQPKR